MNAYQYRSFEVSKEKIPEFDQLDIYFYKPKSTAVGVKARFHGGYQNQAHWNVNRLEFKFIKNYDQVKEGKTILQHWRKVVVDAKFTIYSPSYIESHLETFIKEGETLDDAIQRQLRLIAKNISSALKESDIKEKHFKRNPELAGWLEVESVTDLFLVEKLKSKSSKGQKGEVRASLLYEPSRLKQTKVYITRAYESQKEGRLQNILKSKAQKLDQNTSYPTFIEKIYTYLL